MKKTVLFIVYLFMSLSVVLANAIDLDCRSIPQTQKDALDVDESIGIIRVYNGYYLHGFAAGDTIDNLISDKYVLEEMLVTYEKGSRAQINCYGIRDGNINRLEHGYGLDMSVFLKYTSDNNTVMIEKKIKAKIHSIVCLSAESSHSGIYIYYITEKGDYVLYKEYADSTATYLFPIEEFSAACAKYREEKRKSLVDENGEVRKGSAAFRFSDVPNVSKYRFYSNSLTNGVVIVVIVTAVSVAAAILFILIIRRHKHRPK